MAAFPSPQSNNQQNGAALLLIIIVLFVSASTMILASANYNNPRIKQKVQVRQELGIAKEMLLAYSMQYPEISASGDGPGRLPCPDVDNSGYADTSCSTGVDTFQGRLPLSLDPTDGTMLTFNDVYADSDQQFWYAVDPNYHWSTTANVNTNSASGAFSIDGVSDYVAVLIAPGESLGDQDRTVSQLSDANYLEGGNEDGSDYVSTYATDANNFNDQVLGITRTELMTLATNRVIKEIKDELDAYYQTGHYFRDADTNSCSGPYTYGNSYPRDFTFTGYICFGSCYCYWDTAAVMYNDAMSDAVGWYTGDAWDTVANYTNIANDEATITFDNCDITFTFEYNSGLGESVISRSQPSC